jgi:hypothetical protein
MKNKIFTKTGKYVWELEDFPHNKKLATSKAKAKYKRRRYLVPVVGEIYPCYMRCKVDKLYRTDAVILGVYSPEEFKRLFPEEYDDCRDVADGKYGRYWNLRRSPFFVRAQPLYEAEGDDDTDTDTYYLTKSYNWLSLRSSRLDVARNLEKTYWK